MQCEGGGVEKVGVEENLQKSPSLSDEEAADTARLLVRLEMGKPQDFEWAMEKGKVGLSTEWAIERVKSSLKVITVLSLKYCLYFDLTDQ